MALCLGGHRLVGELVSHPPDGQHIARAPCQRRGCPHLFEGQLCVLMQFPSQYDQAWFECSDVLAEVDECRHDFLS